MIEYRHFAINSDSTIHSYAQGTIYSYKRVVSEKLSSNDKTTMAKRLLSPLVWPLGTSNSGGTGR